MAAAEAIVPGISRGIPMGWTYWQGEKRPTDDVLREPYELAGHMIVASGIKGGVWYAALQPKGEQFVTALIVLFERGGSRFGYKPMDESMGPYESACPADVFRRLSPVADIPHAHFAAQWRDRVRAYHRSQGVDLAPLTDALAAVRRSVAQA